MNARHITAAFVFAATMASPPHAAAGVETVATIDGIRYELKKELDGDTTRLTAHLLPIEPDSHVYRFPEDYDLVIPATVKYEGETYAVVELKDRYDIRDGTILAGALEGEPIASLSLPSTIERIGDWSLLYLDHLKSVRVDPDNRHFKVVDGVLYGSDMKKLWLYPRLREGDSFDVPEGVETLTMQAFSFRLLRHISLPSTLRVIEGDMVEGLHLDGLVLNDGLEYLGDRSLAGLTCDSDIVIPESVTHIGEACFRYAEGPWNLILPEHITEIGDSWFEGDRRETVLIQQHIKKMCYKAFWRSRMKHIELPDGIETIEGSFMDCHNLLEIRLPLALTKLEDGTFGGCDNLKRVTFNKNIRRVNGAFMDCGAITDFYMLCETPPKLDKEHPLGYRNPEYYPNRLGQITVHVLEGCGEAYRNSTWAKVGPIVEDLTDGVDDLPADGPISPTETCTAYTIQGTVAAEGIPYGELRQALSPGIYIIRTPSGKTEKIRL